MTDLAARLQATTDQTVLAGLLADAIATDPVAALTAWSTARHEPFTYATPGATTTHPEAGPCPWTLSGVAATDLRTVLGPWDAHLKSVVKELEKRCVAVVPTVIGGRWHLTWVLQRGAPPTKGKPAKEPLALWRWIGGPPSTTTTLPAPVDRAFDDPIPAQLQALYAVHDGFGPLGSPDRPFDHFAVVPRAALTTMDGVDVPGFAPHGLLVFMINAVGDRFCALNQRRTRVVVWDRATGQGSYEKDTFSFLGRTWLGLLRGDWWMM